MASPSNMSDPYNAAEIILGQAARLKDKTALIHSGGTVSYGEFLSLVNRAANAFCGLGVGRGSRVGLMLKDSPLYCAAFLGLVKAGAVAIPLNPRLPAGSYVSIFTAASLSLVVAEREHAAMLSEAQHLNATRMLASFGDGETLERLVVDAPEGFTAAPTHRNDPA